MSIDISLQSSIDRNSIAHWSSLIEEAGKAHQLSYNKTGLGADYLGWVDLPGKMLVSPELAQIEQSAKKIQQDSDILVVVGIGGSYLGARAVIEALQDKYQNEGILSGKKAGTVVLFAGYNLDGPELDSLLNLLKDYRVSVNVISKSGTTTEPAVAFRHLKEFMEKKYGFEANQRIYATTDAERGALKQLANKQNYQTFKIPDDVGGRFSVFTPVGLLPIQAAGIDIKRLLAGAHKAQLVLKELQGENNPAIVYAAFRSHFFRQGIKIEVLVSYLSATSMISEWWKQLFGESEGKQGKGLWPASVQFTTDLHSLGQWLQEGPRLFFETIINWRQNPLLPLPTDQDNLDNLNYLEQKTMAYINEAAQKATAQAHIEGGADIITINPGELNPENLGCLLYFFEMACSISGYMLAINPFDQPGVEAYKKNMFKLLGKP